LQFLSDWRTPNRGFKGFSRDHAWMNHPLENVFPGALQFLSDWRTPNRGFKGFSRDHACPECMAKIPIPSWFDLNSVLF